MIARKPKTPKAPSSPTEKSAAKDSTVTIVKLKDLVEQIAEATGGNKPAVKRVIEETLAAMGAALNKGSNLAIPPLGRIRVAKVSAGILTLKLRPADSPRASGLDLADEDDDS